VLVSAEMVNVADGRQVWGERYSRSLSDIFLLQEEIAQEISTKLRLKLDAGERARLTKRHTESTEAYHLYLKGRHCWNKRTKEGLRQGIEYFQRAIEVDPHYAQAYAGIADGHSLLSSYGVTPLKESIRSIEEAALKAIELDPTLAEPHAALGHLRALRLWDWPEGEKELKLAIRLNPGYANAHLWYASFLSVMRRFDEALAEVRRAQEHDPLSLFIDSTIGSHYYYRRLYDLAIARVMETLELEGDYGRAHFVLGLCYERKGMYQEALTHFERTIDSIGSDPEVLSSYAFTLARAGNRAAALNILDRLKSSFLEGQIPLPPLPLIYLGLGELGEACEWIERAYLERSSWLPALNIMPQLDELRPDRRFIDVLRRIGLPTE
jgi:tetratricopeptide (TPR) repeat protein